MNIAINNSISSYQSSSSAKTNKGSDFHKKLEEKASVFSKGDTIEIRGNIVSKKIDISSLTNEQKNYLKENYDIKNLDIYSDEASRLMKDLNKFGVLSDEDYNATKQFGFYESEEIQYKLLHEGITIKLTPEFLANRNDISYIYDMYSKLSDKSYSLTNNEVYKKQSEAQSRISQILKDIFN